MSRLAAGPIRRTSEDGGMTRPGVPLSVIVPVFNGAATLHRCLDAIFASEGATFEVVVVDDGSSDESTAIARTFPCRVLELPRNRGVAAARNQGAEAAVHDILVFIDADMFVQRGTLAQIAGCFEADPGLGALGGTDVPDDGETRWGPALLGLFYHFSVGWREGETFKIGRAHV